MVCIAGVCYANSLYRQYINLFQFREGRLCGVEARDVRCMRGSHHAVNAANAAYAGTRTLPSRNVPSTTVTDAPPIQTLPAASS